MCAVCAFLAERCWRSRTSRRHRRPQGLVPRVNPIHADVRSTHATAKAMEVELEDRPSWLGLAAGSRRP
jgi:hypothetical protein